MNEDSTSDLFRLFADLLEYPTAALFSQAGVCLRYLKSVQPEAATTLEEFLQGLQEKGLARMEELYSNTFDLQPVCSPYAGYQLFGESYKRGAFMAKLVDGYRSLGFSAGKELPDHAAVILRFMALGQEAREGDFGRPLLLEGLLPAVEKMAGALAGQDGNPYRAVITALRLFLNSVKEREMSHA
jgi:nitrate reductase molybdenum cofactor assembly chaperone NarJ/NarW